MSPYLPNTNLTSLSIGSKIYCYAQSYHGALIELEGRIDTTKKHNDVYFRENQTNIGMTVRYRDDDDDDNDEAPPSDVPKMFTPLAAASLGNTRVSISFPSHFHQWLTRNIVPNIRERCQHPSRHRLQRWLLAKGHPLQSQRCRR